MGSARLSYDYVDNRYLEDNSSNHNHPNGNNGFPVIDYELHHLTNEIDIQILRDRVTAIEEKLQLEMDALNGKIDDVRAGHVDCLSMNDQFNHRLNTLQVNYSRVMPELVFFKKTFGTTFGFVTGITFAVMAYAGLAWFGVRM